MQRPFVRAWRKAGLVVRVSARALKSLAPIETSFAQYGTRPHL